MDSPRSRREAAAEIAAIRKVQWDMTDNCEIAIAKVYERVKFVAKQHAPGLGYSYASEAAIIEELRPAMQELGLTVRVHAIRDVVRESTVTKSGAIGRLTTMLATVRFTHALSGSFVDVEAMGEGMDVGDKSAAKAATMALKYALRQTFMLETGDDPDATPSSNYEQRAPAAPDGRKRDGHAAAPYPWLNALERSVAEDHITKADISAVIGAKSTSANLDAWLKAQEITIAQAIELFKIERTKRVEA